MARMTFFSNDSNLIILYRFYQHIIHCQRIFSFQPNTVINLVHWVRLKFQPSMVIISQLCGLLNNRNFLRSVIVQPKQIDKLEPNIQNWTQECATTWFKELRKNKKSRRPMDRDESKETNNYKSSLLQIRFDKLTGNYRERKDENKKSVKMKTNRDEC